MNQHVAAAETAEGAAALRRATLLGALLMVIATFCFTSLDSILKALSARHDVLFLAWGRNLFQVLYLAALMPLLGARRMVRTRHPWIQLARGALLASGTVFIVLALGRMPMAQAYAITFSAPLIAVLIAVIALGERPSLTRWACIVGGFVGVVIALGPGSPEAGWHLLLPLAVAVVNGLYHVLTRAIAADEDPYAMLFLTGAVACALTGLSLPWTWTVMAPWEWGLLAIGGAFGALAHLMLVFAFRIAPTSIVSPMVYVQILSAAGLGYAVFGEVPSATTLAGAAVVSLSGIVLVRTRR